MSSSLIVIARELHDDNGNIAECGLDLVEYDTDV